MWGDGSGRVCGGVMHSLLWDPFPVGTSLWTLARTVCCSLPSLALMLLPLCWLEWAKGSHGGPRYMMSFNCPINYRLAIPHLCHLM